MKIEKGWKLFNDSTHIYTKSSTLVTKAYIFNGLRWQRSIKTLHGFIAAGRESLWSDCKDNGNGNKK